MWKLELEFLNYCLLNVLGLSCPKLVFYSQTPRSIIFFSFHDFTRFISWFLRKWGLVCGNWSQGSGRMAGYVFWAQVDKCSFQIPGPKVNKLFKVSKFYWIHLMIHEKNEVLFVKIGAKVLDIWLDRFAIWCLLGPSGQSVISRPQVPRSINLKNEVLFVKIGARAQDLCWIRLLGPSDPNGVPRSQTPTSINFLRFHNFAGFVSWFLRKWGLVCENRSEVSGLTANIGLINVLRFHNFIGFISFLWKWGPVFENWS